MNLYTYCENDPIIYVDPSGHITQREERSYRNGTLSKEAHDYLQNLTKQWYAAKTQNKKEEIHRKAEEFRKNNYKKKITDKIKDTTIEGASNLFDAGGKISKFNTAIVVAAGTEYVQQQALGKIGSKIAPGTVKGMGKSVSNMGEFFQDSFGKSIKNNLSKTKLQYDGQSIYKVTNKTGNEYLKKGYGVYLDALHKDHLEVIDKAGKVKYVLNLDGTLNADKTAKVIGRTIKGW